MLFTLLIFAIYIICKLITDKDINSKQNGGIKPLVFKPKGINHEHCIISNYNYGSNYAKVSFDGFINENYFQINSKEKNLLLNIEISHGISKNPINNKLETFIGLLLKSKYDGIGDRKPIDLSINVIY